MTIRKSKVSNLFVCAMQLEANPIIEYYEMRKLDLIETKFFKREETVVPYDIFVSHDHDCALLITGIGKINAAAGTAYAISLLKPKKTINIGLAGNLTDKQIGEIFSIEIVYQYDIYVPETIIKGYNSIEETAISLFTSKKKCRLVSGDTFIDVEKYKDFLSQTGDLCDMEGYAIAQISRKFIIGCEIYKIVSDSADKEAEKNFLDSLGSMINQKVLLILENNYKKRNLLEKI